MRRNFTRRIRHTIVNVNPQTKGRNIPIEQRLNTNKLLRPYIHNDTVPHTVTPLNFNLAKQSNHLTFQGKLTKLDTNDKRFGPVVTRAKSRSERYRCREVLLEGHRLIYDAMDAGAVLKSVFLCNKSDAAFFSGTQAPIYVVSRAHMKLWSELVTPSGLMAIFEMPSSDIAMTREFTLPLTLVCDNIRDPGNMGTIIRLAAAVQCDQVILPHGCVDIWDPKVIRSAMGCHFRVPLYNNLTWPQVDNYLDDDSTVILADVSRMDNNHTLNSMVDNCNYKGEVMENRHKNIKNYKNILNENFNMSSFVLHTVPYYEIDFVNCYHTLVICNESVGPSDEAKKFVHEKYGKSVDIPIGCGVESLNSAMAAAVIMFEVRRQALLFGTC